MRWAAFSGVMMLLLARPAVAPAGSAVRYALVIGNNHGGTKEKELPDLKLAEAEATRIRDHLVRIGNFNSNRVVLLTNKTRKEILAAAQMLAEQHRRDRRVYGDLPTMFVFFFTGHGLKGKLLTSGEPLTGPDLGGIFKRMAATFTVGVFDACFSGSMDLRALRAKGIRLTPGFNAFSVLPREVLHAKGTMWFVSSRQDQVSYEDNRLGGVFTHFFLEGMEKATGDSIGVTLDEIWEYSRSRTQRYTERAGAPQTPQKMIRNLTTTGPLYFSFPRFRSAYLSLAPQISGHFLIRYGRGQMAEAISKKKGEAMTVPVFPSEVVLERVDQSHDRKSIRRFSLKSGQTVWVKQRASPDNKTTLGAHKIRLHAKGNSLRDIVLMTEVSRWTGLLALSYRAAFGQTYSTSAPYGVQVGFRADHGHLFVALGFLYGHKSGDFEAWGYNLNQAGLALEAGAAFNLSKFRLGVAATGKFSHKVVSFRNDTSRTGEGYGVGACGSVLYPVLEDPIRLYATVQAGLMAEYMTPVVPIDAEPQWEPIPWITVGASVKLF